jgi:hypothetical protein
MEQNRLELKSKIRTLTFKFGFVGWLAAAATMTFVFTQYSFGRVSHLDYVKQILMGFGVSAAVFSVPLALSTWLASRWMNWVVSTEHGGISAFSKYFYGAFFTVFIAVAGAGTLVLFGNVIFECFYDLYRSGEFKFNYSWRRLFELIIAGVGYPLFLGIWIEIPIIFIFAHKVRKITRSYINRAI